MYKHTHTQNTPQTHEMIKQNEVFHPRHWTPEEHQRFLTGLNMYGHKDIKAISRFVGTRNETQVRAPLYLRGARRRTARGCCVWPANARASALALPGDACEPYKC